MGNDNKYLIAGLFLSYFLDATDNEIRVMKDRMDDKSKEFVKDIIRRFNILLED